MILRLLLSVIVLSAVGCMHEASPAPPAATTIHFKVDGMHCTGCEDAIKAKMLKLPGVTACEASHSDAAVAVTTTDPGIAQAAVEQIDALGYQASLAAP